VRLRLAQLPEIRRAALLADMQLLADIMGAPANGEGPFLYNPPISASPKRGKGARASKARRRTA
jgi:hypothetical protein